MRILIATSEAVPFAKTGGLADVATGLARSLGDLGHEVTLVLPYHRRFVPAEIPVEETGTSVSIRMDERDVSAEIWRARLANTPVDVLLIDQPAYFDRGGLYTESGVDYGDNCERYAFFSRAVMEAARKLELSPDVIHANDWQTGLIPALLEAKYRQTPTFSKTASIITVHNLAFQGRFPGWCMKYTGLDWKYFNWLQMEFWGDLNLLKTGIVFAQKVTTVSPTYAREICQPEFGCGLDTVLASRSEDLVGILNGVDTSEWNPSVDRHIPQRYSAGSWKAGKAACKRELQRESGLPERPDVPLFGMISRLTDQKGLDLIADVADDFLRNDVQIAFLGTGEAHCEQLVRSLALRAPDKVSAVIGFDEQLAHRIEAGADIYLMPSRFEPCGLNQQYSMAYGTIPIVHAVGGLADSVVDASGPNLMHGRATGFVFHDYAAGPFAGKIRESLRLYDARPTRQSVVEAGMKRDCSWERSAAEYLDVYRGALEKLPD
ncbi:MAG: glycogen synthase GlgA [Planctomycetota bacterium]|nr:MAG: glycogen synthase GlgA [Planctomycetota bacterium]REJ89513.1 MAG: glycogen synthase GlgA [Planctomycetota bacterium]REK28916.1 MAG: glycogen synthase GlgA [Planctomycetota bacterium]REK39650.1 MAG: glycogen synthase GlgA [Planctomycetota bacterium]